ncbi:MAG: cell wall metabolism sensor histidine kinase WalK [Clostridia bacterium]|nr:cell wall metabolism sensor histidine kinase WalK [Clostridia bacterium]
MFLKKVLRALLRSLQWRLVFIFILMTITLMILIFVPLNSVIDSLYYDTFKEQIKNGYKDWTDIAIKENPTEEDIKNSFGEKKGDHELYFHAYGYLSVTAINKESMLKNRDRGVFYSSDSLYKEEQRKFIDDIFANSDNLMSLLAKGEYKNENKLIRGSGRDYYEYIITRGNIILYFIYDKNGWNAIINNFYRIFIQVILIAVILSLVLGYALSKTITLPIINVMHKAQKIAAGDFDHTLEVKSDDEIGKLTKTFNYMAKELKSTLIEISSEKNKVETILNYMTDGVIAFNLKGEAIHANPASKRMLGLDDPNIPFNEFSRKFNLEVSLEEIIYLGTADGKERNIDTDGKFIRAYFAVFTDEDKKAEGIIVVLQDITEQQKLERMRQEFVANVSHELRTPLTSIKSYTETLLDGAIEDRDTTERFLTVIDSEADRMTRLVKDLLQLSRLDNQQMQWNMRKFSFVELVRGAVEKLQIEANNKNHLLESYVIGEIPEIEADRDRIEQVVLNILSNAVKYTPPNGKITVYIGKMYSDVYVKVADNGIGIPQKDICRIFERFYRVDKARSREMGGTGLGLAIAKEIVEAHGGTIGVSSEEGKGTEIIVKLPIQKTESGVSPDTVS